MSKGRTSLEGARGANPNPIPKPNPNPNPIHNHNHNLTPAQSRGRIYLDPVPLLIVYVLNTIRIEDVVTQVHPASRSRHVCIDFEAMTQVNLSKKALPLLLMCLN